MSEKPTINELDFCVCPDCGGEVSKCGKPFYDDKIQELVQEFMCHCCGEEYLVLAVPMEFRGVSDHE